MVLPNLSCKTKYEKATVWDSPLAHVLGDWTWRPTPNTDNATQSTCNSCCTSWSHILTMHFAAIQNGRYRCTHKHVAFLSCTWSLIDPSRLPGHRDTEQGLPLPANVLCYVSVLMSYVSVSVSRELLLCYVSVAASQARFRVTWVFPCYASVSVSRELLLCYVSVAVTWAFSCHMRVSMLRKRFHVTWAFVVLCERLLCYMSVSVSRELLLCCVSVAVALVVLRERFRVTCAFSCHMRVSVLRERLRVTWVCVVLRECFFIMSRERSCTFSACCT